MAISRQAQVHGLIASLNALEVGELQAIESKLVVAREQLGVLGERDLQALLVEAASALGRADLVSFRRLVAQTVARLGHLR